MDKQLAEYVVTHGREKSCCAVVDRGGVQFRIGNYVCDGKVYFVVSANSKIVECMEIEVDHVIEIDSDFETILICAVRYALGRRTYMPHLVIGYITPMLPMLSKLTLSVMEKDVMFEGNLGDEQIDKPSWMQFLKDIQKELKKKAKGESEG